MRGPVWVAMSPANASIVQELWDDPSQAGAGITGMTAPRGLDAQGELLSRIDEIELHHGPLSSTPPFTELEVIGAQMSADICERLAEHGFLEIEAKPGGFVCRRG